MGTNYTGRGGRPRKPDSVKKEQGTFQKCRAREEVIQTSSHLDSPKWLSPNAKLVWDYLMEQYKDTQILSLLDVPGLAIYCDHYAMYLEADALFVEGGRQLCVENQRGQLAENPLLSIKRKNMAAMRAWAAGLGLTPCDRLRLAGLVKKDEEKNEFDAIDA